MLPFYLFVPPPRMVDAWTRAQLTAWTASFQFWPAVARENARIEARAQRRIESPLLTSQVRR